MSKQIPPQVVKNINELLTDEPRRPTQIMKAYSKKFSKGLNTKAIGFLNIEAMLRATPGVEMVMLDGEENYVNARDYRESLKNRNQTRTNSAAAKKPTSKKEKDARKAKPSSQLKISNSSFWSGNFATDLNKSVWTAGLVFFKLFLFFYSNFY